MNEFFVYLLFMASNLKDILIGVSIVSGMCWGLFLGIYIYNKYMYVISGDKKEDPYYNSTTTTMNYSKTMKFFKSLTFISFLIFIPSLILSVFIPTTDQLVTIFILPKLLTVDNLTAIESIPPKVLEILNISLDELKDFILSK